LLLAVAVLLGGVTVAAAAPHAPGFVVGRAKHIGNDYPWETVGQFEHQNEGVDPWREFAGQCDSFAAWKVYENLNGDGPAPHPPMVPDVGWSPGNAAISNVDQDTWGNAGDWLVGAPAHGWVVDDVPSPGAIAIWGNGHLGAVGHVGYVDDVYPDGSITVENYNLHVNGEYSKFHLAPGGGPETSFGATYQLPWPDGFAHIGDGPALDPTGKALPPEQPELTSTEYGYQYSPDVHLAGPGSPAGVFTTTGTWHTDVGHGELGNMRYTTTSGTAPTATATWTPTGLTANTCYRIDALVPDQFSDNPIAHYVITSAAGRATASIDENVITNDWGALGVYRTSSTGGLTVRLDNGGATGAYVAADALRLLPRATPC
jgi:surface antigen